MVVSEKRLKYFLFDFQSHKGEWFQLFQLKLQVSYSETARHEGYTSVSYCGFSDFFGGICRIFSFSVSIYFYFFYFLYFSGFFGRHLSLPPLDSVVYTARFQRNTWT